MPGGDDPAGIHGDRPVESLSFIHVSRGNEHAHAGPLFPDVVDQVPELLTRQRVDAGRRLVEDEQVGVVNQRAAEANLLFHSAGELARGPVGERTQAGGVEQVPDARLSLGVGHAKQSREEVDVLENAQLEVQILAQPLRHEGDPRTNGLAMVVSFMSPPRTRTSPV